MLEHVFIHNTALDKIKLKHSWWSPPIVAILSPHSDSVCGSPGSCCSAGYGPRLCQKDISWARRPSKPPLHSARMLPRYLALWYEEGSFCNWPRRVANLSGVGFQEKALPMLQWLLVPRLWWRLGCDPATGYLVGNMSKQSATREKQIDR